ncbi:MAG TPA: phytanoyl-CoA dioxygenase family protein [Limnochordia bacterium]
MVTARAFATDRAHLDGAKEAFDKDGYLVIRGLIDRAEIDALCEHFMQLHAGGPIPGCFNPVPAEEAGGDVLKVYPRMMHPHRVSEMAMRYMLDERILDVLAVLFGEEPMAAQSMFYFKPPGARGQALHQDNFYLKADPGTCIAAWVAVDRADRENGGLVVVPGSQGMEIVCPEQADPAESFTTHLVRVPPGLEEVGIDLDPGDVLFFNGSVIHGSYPNRSRDRFRRSFICHYVGVSCTQIARYYNPLYLRDGTSLTLAENPDGGPCGQEFAPKGPH